MLCTKPDAPFKQQNLRHCQLPQLLETRQNFLKISEPLSVVKQQDYSLGFQGLSCDQASISWTVPCPNPNWRLHVLPDCLPFRTPSGGDRALRPWGADWPSLLTFGILQGTAWKPLIEPFVGPKAGAPGDCGHGWQWAQPLVGSRYHDYKSSRGTHWEPDPGTWPGNHQSHRLPPNFCFRHGPYHMDCLDPGCSLEMCQKRKGKKWERERNRKETRSFLSRSFIFGHPVFPFLAQIMKNGWKKRRNGKKNGWKDVERRRTAVLPFSRFSNLARFHFLYRLKPVFAPVLTPFSPLSKPIFAPFQTRSCPFLVLLIYHI